MVLKRLHLVRNATYRSKFAENFVGPYTIISHIGNGAYRISDADGQLDTVHIDRLKTAKVRPHLIPEVLSASRPIRRGVQQFRMPG